MTIMKVLKKNKDCTWKYLTHKGMKIGVSVSLSEILHMGEMEFALEIESRITKAQENTNYTVVKCQIALTKSVVKVNKF